MKNLENIINTIINGDSVEVMKEMPNSFVDLVVVDTGIHSSKHQRVYGSVDK